MNSSNTGQIFAWVLQMLRNKQHQLVVLTVGSVGAAHLEVLLRQAFLCLGISDHGSHVTFHQISQDLLQQPNTQHQV